MASRKYTWLLSALGLSCGLFAIACGVESDAAPSTVEPSPEPTSHPNLLLPDLEVRAPEELYVQAAAGTGETELRFSTTFLNTGEGALIIAGNEPHEGANRTPAEQHIEQRNGGVLKRPAGHLVIEPTHGHWHMEEFTVFELWRPGRADTPAKLIATTGKGSFCAMDTAPIATPAVGPTPEPGFWECDAFEQGISAGWTDLYPAGLPGQRLSLAGVPDGMYVIRTIVDPSDLLVEADDSNNEVFVLIELAGGSANRLLGGELIERLVDALAAPAPRDE